MAQLYFYYSAMNAGKSTTLLQSAFNYRERGMRPFIITAAIDNRAGVGKVASRIGLEAEAQVFESQTDVKALLMSAHTENKIDCVLVDECQFLTKAQVAELTDIVDELRIRYYAMVLERTFVVSCLKARNICWHGQIN